MRDSLAILAVDDERHALEDLARMLEESQDVAEVEKASEASDVLVRLGERRFDALFLDVQMPQVTGLELARVLRRLDEPPAIVFVSAHERGAAEAFSLRAVDYMLKPVTRERLDDALARIPRAQVPATPGNDLQVLAVEDIRGDGTRLLPVRRVLYVEADGDYVRVVTDRARYVARARLSELEDRLEPFGFVKIHRSYLANLRWASAVRRHHNGTATLVVAGGAEIPVARRQVPELRRRLGM